MAADILPMFSAHLREVVEIHARCFPRYNTTRYGSLFLRVFYGEFARSAGAVSFVSTDARGRVTGFVGGVLDYRTFYRHLLLRNPLRLALAMAVAVARRPDILLGAIRRGIATARVASKRQPSAPGGLPELAFLSGVPFRYLTSIAVLPEARGSGTALALVDALTRELTMRGCRYCLLDTEAENEAGNRFFRKAGFRFVTSYSLFEKDRAGNVYLKDLGAAEESTAIGVARPTE